MFSKKYILYAVGMSLINLKDRYDQASVLAGTQYSTILKKLVSVTTLVPAMSVLALMNRQ